MYRYIHIYIYICIYTNAHIATYIQKQEPRAYASNDSSTSAVRYLHEALRVHVGDGAAVGSEGELALAVGDAWLPVLQRPAVLARPGDPQCTFLCASSNNEGYIYILYIIYYILCIILHCILYIIYDILHIMYYIRFCYPSDQRTTDQLCLWHY